MYWPSVPHILRKKKTQNNINNKNMDQITAAFFSDTQRPREKY